MTRYYPPKTIGRDAGVRQLWFHGVSAARIAHVYGITDTQVYEIVGNFGKGQTSLEPAWSNRGDDAVPPEVA